MAGIFIVLSIAISAGIIFWESFQKFLDPEPIPNLPWVVAAAIVGFVGNEAVAVLQIRVGQRYLAPQSGKRQNSLSLRACWGWSTSILQLLHAAFGDFGVPWGIISDYDINSAAVSIEIYRVERITMKQNRVGLTITLLIAGIVMLLISVGLEYVISRLQAEANRTFQFWSFEWARAVAPLLLAALFLGLAWFAMRMAGGTRPGGILLLILGLPAVLFIPLVGLGLRTWLPRSMRPMNVMASDYVRFTGAFLTVVGVYLIFRPGLERS